MARDVLVIGAGVVGLAVARALALAGDQVLVAEATGQIGSGVSSRNSEVLHAGLYYKPGSLKARVCVAGRSSIGGLLRGAFGAVRVVRQIGGRYGRGSSTGVAFP